MSTPPPAVKLVDVCIDYGAVRAVDHVSLQVAPNTIHVLLGRSGSGKTSVLRAIAGFEPLSGGSIAIGDRVVDDPPKSVWIAPEQRNIGFVFQDYALFGHLDAADNVGFGVAGSATARRQAAATWLDRVQLAAHGSRRPAQLSGGEQQRVALARALAREPALVLLDEPFSNLDPDLRRDVRNDTVALLRSTGSSAIFVTHDVEEAFSIADTLSILDQGRVAQTGTPRQLYETPASHYVARLCGPASFLTIESIDGELAQCALGEVSVRPTASVGDVVVLRPERLSATAGGELEIVRRRFLGGCEEVEVEVGEHVVVCRITPGTLDDDATHVGVRYDGVAATITP